MLVRTIGELVRRQSLVTVAGKATVSEASKKMSAHNVKALIVTDGPRMVGIVSLSDVLDRCHAAGEDADVLPVSAVMTRQPLTVDLQQSLADALRMMMQGDFSHLPVVEPGGEVIGIVTLLDIPEEYRLMVERFSAYKALNSAA